MDWETHVEGGLLLNLFMISTTERKRSELKLGCPERDGSDLVLVRGVVLQLIDIVGIGILIIAIQN